MYIGKSVRPFEDYRFTTGRGKYVDDIRLKDMAYLKIIRSSYARARIKYIGFNNRRALLFIKPGDVSGYVPVRVDPEVAQYARIARMPILPIDVANFVGQPIAAIVARDPYEAEDLLEEVSIDYEPLDPVVDPLRAFEKGAPQIHTEIPGNLAIDKRSIGGDTGFLERPMLLLRLGLKWRESLQIP